MQRSKTEGRRQPTNQVFRFPIPRPLHEEVVIEMVDVEDPKQRKLGFSICNADALVAVVHFSQCEENKQDAVELLAKTVDKLTNGEALLFVALYSQDLPARLTAVEKLRDNYDSLSIIAEQSEYSETRMLAKQMIARTQNSKPKTN